MATGIPLPGDFGESFGRGLERGGSLFSRIMQPVLEREKMKQAEAHFQEQLKLRKAAAGRTGANSDLQRQLLEQQLLGLKHKNDPLYEFNQFKALQDMITGSNSNISSPQSMPTQSMGQGMGIFSPESLEQIQEQPISSLQSKQSTNGIDLEVLKKNPLLRAFFKNKFHMDPLAQVPQSPEEKQATALNLFQKKEDIKKQGKGGDIPTNTVLTQNQQAIQGIDTVIPMLDELLESKNIPGIFDLSPGKKAAYNAKTSSMIDTLIAAQSLPKVQASIDLVEEQIRRKTGETVTDYKKRLGSLRDDLVQRRGRSKSVLQKRKVNTAELPAQEKQLNGIKYRKIDGEWHEV